MESFTAVEKLSSAQPLTVEEFERGNINYSDVMEEVNYLKLQIPLIRQSMETFLVGMTNMDRTTTQSMKKIQKLQTTMDEYVERYKKLIPLIELVNQELPVDTKASEKYQPTIQIPTSVHSSSSSNITATIANGKKTSVSRKRTYTKKNPGSSSAVNTPTMVGNLGNDDIY